MNDTPSSIEEIGLLRMSRAVAFVVGLPSFMVGTAVFMLGFSLGRPGILAAAATLHGVAFAALAWWVASRLVPLPRVGRALGLAACALLGGAAWRALLIMGALHLLGTPAG